MNNAKRRRIAKESQKNNSRPSDLQVVALLQHRTQIAKINEDLGVVNRKQRRAAGYVRVSA